MHRIADRIAVGLFLAFLVIPVGTLSLLGYSSWAENPPHLADISAQKLVSPSKKYRAQIAREAVIGSPVAMAAITTRSQLDLAIGYVHTARVISGVRGWFFYVPEFECQPVSDAQQGVDTVETYRYLASIANVDLRYSVSPDKPVIYPEKLGDLRDTLAACKLEFAKSWRILAARSGAGIIDPLPDLVAASQKGLTYFTTDTHWNHWGAITAVRQLTRIYAGADPGVWEVKYGQHFDMPSGLMRMLRVEASEPGDHYYSYVTERIQPLVGTGIDAVVIGDSFYSVATPYLTGLFGKRPIIGKIPEGTFATKPRRILINSVERAFFDRLKDRSATAWLTPLHAAILRWNAEKTASCVFHDVDVSTLPIFNMTPSGRDFAASGDAAILVKLPAAPEPCFRFSMENDGPSQIFLPSPDNTYREGLSVIGGSSMALALGDDYSGKTIRIDPIPGRENIRGLKIEIGSRSLQSTKLETDDLPILK
jgi:hypothetical protein